MKNDIKKTLPQLTKEHYAALLECLTTNGVLNHEYATALKEEDLGDCIPKIMRRVLIAKWTAAPSAPGPSHSQDRSASNPNDEFSAGNKCSSLLMVPTLDFDAFAPDMKALLKKSRLAKTDKSKIFRYIGNFIVEEHKLDKNLPNAAWTSVALKLAANFYDDKAVIKTAASLGRYVGYKLSTSYPVASTSGTEAPPTTPTSAKKRKVASQVTSGAEK